MNKSIFLAMSSILVLSGVLAGCGGDDTKKADSQQSSANQEAKVVKMNLRTEPPTADPGISEDTTSGAVIRATFDGLTRTGDDNKPHESVAEKIEVSSDQLTYTFTLRDSKWSNGDPVTARDFEFAWKRALDPKTASNYAYQLYYIKNGEKFNKGQAKMEDVGVKALDDKTLQVQLENPTPFFLELTAFYTYYPVNEKVVKANPKWATQADTHVGNGPFKIKSWEHKNKMILVKNENYWDKDKVKLDEIQFTMVDDLNTELSMFDNGELDWAGAPLSNLPLDAVPALKEAGKMVTKPIAGTYFYRFNTEQPPFNNVKIRKAFTYAIDRQAIIDNVTQTDQQPALGYIPPIMSVAANPYFKDHDLDTAKKLLQEGMKELGISKLPPITLSFNTSENHKKLAEAIQDQWKKAFNIEVKLDNKEWKVYLDDVHQGKYQVSRAGWLGDFNDPYSFLVMFKEKNGGNNDTRWENPTYKDLLTKSMNEVDTEKRKQLLAQAEQILMEEMPIAPIYYYTDSWVQNDKLKGVVIDGMGYIDMKWANLE